MMLSRSRWRKTPRILRRLVRTILSAVFPSSRWFAIRGKVADHGLLIKPSAAKEGEAVGTKRDRQRIVVRIQSLVTGPRLPGSEWLAGSAAPSRVRQGNYRGIYVVDDARRIIEVIKGGHRREVYRTAP